MTLVEAWRIAFVRDVEVTPDVLNAAQTQLYEEVLRLAPKALGGLAPRGRFDELRDEVVQTWIVRRLRKRLPLAGVPVSDEHVRRSIMRSVKNCGLDVLRSWGFIVKPKQNQGPDDEPPLSMTSPLTPKSDVISRDDPRSRVEQRTDRLSAAAWDERRAVGLDGPAGARSNADEIALGCRAAASRMALGFEGVGGIVVRNARSNAVANARAAHGEHGELLRARTTLDAIYAGEPADSPTKAKNNVNQRHKRFRVAVENGCGDALAEGVIEAWQHERLPAFILWMASADGLARWAERGEPIILPEHDTGGAA